MHHEFLGSLFAKTAGLVRQAYRNPNVVKDNWTERHRSWVIVIRSLDHVSIANAREVQRALCTQNQAIPFSVGTTSFSARKCPHACSNLTQSIQLKIQTLEGTAVGTSRLQAPQLSRVRSLYTALKPWRLRSSAANGCALDLGRKWDPR